MQPMYFNHFKKFSFALLSAAFVLFLSSCGNKDDNFLNDGQSLIQGGIFTQVEDGQEINKELEFPFDYVIRKRYVSLNEDFYQTTILEGKKDDKVVLNLFDDVSVTVKTTDLINKGDGITVWKGDIESKVYGRAIFTNLKTVVIGRIQIDDKMYRIWPANERQMFIAEMDASAFPDEYCSMQDEGLGNDVQPELGPVAQERNTVMRVMLLFPRQMRNACQKVFGLRMSDLLKADYEENAEDVFDAYGNTNITLDINVVCLNNYSAVGGILSSDLNYIKSDATISAMRDALRADLVALIVPSSSYCGLAQYNTPPVNSSDINRVFSVTKSSCALDNYSFVHEIGHNLGLRHDRTASNYTSNATCNFGHLIRVNNSVSSRTVMSYGSSCGNCSRVGRYSNNVTETVRLPFGQNITIEYGIDCRSTFTGFFGPADNQYHFQTSAGVVSSFR
ncbi:MAG: M12 family metallo-peptidase [Bacteroidota bacterium]